MKPFLCVFIPLWLLLVGLGYWGLAVSFPSTDPSSFPEWKQRFGAQVFDAVTFSARWSGAAAILVGAAVWALLCSAAFAILRRRR